MRRELGDANGKAEERAVAYAHLADATRTVSEISGVTEGTLSFCDVRPFCRLAS
jgi:hypothetical protein